LGYASIYEIISAIGLLAQKTDERSFTSDAVRCVAVQWNAVPRGAARHCIRCEWTFSPTTMYCFICTSCV